MFLSVVIGKGSLAYDDGILVIPAKLPIYKRNNFARAVRREADLHRLAARKDQLRGHVKVRPILVLHLLKGRDTLFFCSRKLLEKLGKGHIVALSQRIHVPGTLLDRNHNRRYLLTHKPPVEQNAPCSAVAVFKGMDALKTQVKTRLTQKGSRPKS